MAQINNEMMAEVNNEEFVSGSKLDEQFFDEICLQQNHTYCLPGMNTEKQKMNFSSLSGVIGDLDLTVEFVYFVCVYILYICIQYI